MIQSKNHDGAASHASGRGVREQSRRILRDVKELGAIAVDDLGDGTDRVKARGKKLLADGRHAMARYQDEAKEYIAENPFKTLLVALGVGTLLGFVLRRSS
ncbi:MAG: hypothetical protein JNL90_02650 [Planctomycetes bacterium]|nr:hypothetical protein [Planctomycetota bacterium]